VIAFPQVEWASVPVSPQKQSGKELCLQAATGARERWRELQYLFRAPTMWSRKTRVALAPRRSKSFGPRAIEPLEDRALMSMGGQGFHAVHPSFVQTNLVSDLASLHPVTVDPDLVNPWGLAAGPTTPWWVSDNGAGVSTLYNGNTAAKLGLTVTIPSPTAPSGGTPTGIVFSSSTTDFLVNGPGTAAHFLFATEDGTIAAWNSGNSATIKVDHSSVPAANSGAVYKGLALASVRGADYLYATNFRAGTVDVFDKNFAPHTFFARQFKDPLIPRGFAPFGIAKIHGDLFVTYARQDAAKHDDVAGLGLGFVDEFSPNGHLIERVAARGTLNSPWGLAVAPKGFGRFSGDLLVGNFGDGRINAFKPVGHDDFRFDGQLKDSLGRPITIDGLWGLAFGNGGSAGPATTLFFTAGINDEQHGLFGTLTPSK